MAQRPIQITIQLRQLLDDARYIAALRAADKHDFIKLFEFVDM